MAKKSRKNLDRREAVDKMRQDQARKERVRSLAILGVCVVIVAGLLTAALIPYLKDKNQAAKLAAKPVSKIGVSEAAAGCEPIKTTATDKNQQHIASGPITYKDAPPSFGPHRPQPAAFDRKFYTAADRPEVAELVHNLEHGYTIAWYDDTVANDKTQVAALRSISEKYGSVRFIAAPWTATDGKAFPDGKHLSLTRWSADANKPTDEKLQKGNWEYCSQVSGKVISSFVTTWPNAESPEPGIM